MSAGARVSATTSVAWTATAAALAVGGFLVLGLSLATHYWFNVRTHAGETCLHIDVPEEAAFDATPYNTKVIWWPMGVECTFDDEGDNSAITVQSDWGLTTAALIGAAAIALSIAIPVVRNTRAKRS
ncbi:hypothetical protein EV379_1645 [Microterricola gilva]|uniref:Uncharacterized protein n=1 Tax=Microterricola gilva TaxID=393267 RepID=A0A4Q8AMY7_9MICO|nr:hypothetical protein [Microterricola gilva]RZU65315.1 hypothetical protein EV379_1645 [Microterricola gilva]